jgi:hypothetical protein
VRTLEAAKQAGVISDEAYQGFRKQAIGLVTAQLSAADYHKELVKLAGALREVKIAGSGPSRTGQDGDQAAVEQALLERRLNFLKAQAAAQSAQAGLPGIAALQDLQLAAAERDYKLGLLAFEDYVTKRRHMLEASATAELAVIDATRKAADLETKQRTAELAAAQQGGRPDEIAKATEALNKAKVEEEKLSSATTAALVKEARANIELAQAEEEHRRALEAVRLENAAAAAEVKISALEGDPYLTRLDIQDALLKALKDRAAAVDGLIAHYQKLRDAASDAAQKEEFQSKIIGLQGEQQGIGRKIQDTEDSASIGKQMQRAMTQLRAEGENIAKNLADVFKNTIGAAIDSISRGISGLILGTKTWGQALREIGTSVLNTIIEGIIKAGLQWVVSELFKAAEGKAIAAAQLAALAPIAAAQSAIWAFPATLATIASFGVAADQAPALIAAAEFETLFTAAFAEGGRPGVGQVSLVGERGPELFVPDSAGTILPAGTTAAILRDSGGQRVSGGSQRSASPTNMHLAIITDEAKLPAWTNQAHGEAWVVRVAQKNAHKIQGPRG